MDTPVGTVVVHPGNGRRMRVSLRGPGWLQLVHMNSQGQATKTVHVPKRFLSEYRIITSPKEGA